MSQKKLLKRIRADGRRIAKHFKLKYLQITAEPPHVRDYGSCDEDSIIRIRLHSLKDGRFLKYKNLLHTLCHELAHLKHMHHRRDFKELNEKILAWVKSRGIYPYSACKTH